MKQFFFAEPTSSKGLANELTRKQAMHTSTRRVIKLSMVIVNANVFLDKEMSWQDGSLFKGKIDRKLFKHIIAFSSWQ